MTDEEGHHRSQRDEASIAQAQPNGLMAPCAGVQWALCCATHWVKRSLVCNFSFFIRARRARSEEHTSELQPLMRISYAVFCLKKKTRITEENTYIYNIITNIKYNQK